MSRIPCTGRWLRMPAKRRGEHPAHHAASASRAADSTSAGCCPVLGPWSFRRIVDIPFQVCVAALDNGQPAGQHGKLPIGQSLLRGPIEHDPGSGTCRIEVPLSRGPLRAPLRMRLDINRWSATATALELIPCRRVRPTAAYFRAGHLLLDSLTDAVPQRVPPAHARETASQPHALTGPGRLAIGKAPS